MLPIAHAARPDLPHCAATQHVLRPASTALLAAASVVALGIRKTPTRQGHAISGTRRPRVFGGTDKPRRRRLTRPHGASTRGQESPLRPRRAPTMWMGAATTPRHRRYHHRSPAPVPSRPTVAGTAPPSLSELEFY